MKFNGIGVFTCLSLIAALNTGCGSSGGGKIQSRLSSGSGSSSGTLSLMNDGFNLGRDLINAIGTLTGGSGSSGLASMKYYINSIQICKEMTPNGTAYTQQSGCIELYKGGWDSNISSNGSTPNYASMMTYAKTHTDGYIDLLSASDRANLSGSATLNEGDGGDYKWGIVNWAYPIKIKGTVTLSDNSTLVTKDGTYSNGTSGGQNTATDLTTGTAEEAIVSLPNGGTWFAFQTPFTVDETQEYTMDLVFNPDGILKGQNTVATNNPPLKDGSNSMSIPFLNLSPVPHKASDTVSKDTYIAQVDSGNYHYNVRLELYYVTGDSNKTIYGVDVQTVARSGQASDPFSDFQKVSYVDKSGTTLNFLDYQKAALISGFTMKDTAGQTTTATISCSTSANLPGCGSAITFTKQ